MYFLQFISFVRVCYEVVLSFFGIQCVWSGVFCEQFGLVYAINLLWRYLKMVDKTRSSSMAEDTAVSFAKHMDNYIKNSEAIVAAVQAAALPLRKGQKKVLKTNLLHWKVS